MKACYDIVHVETFSLTFPYKIPIPACEHEKAGLQITSGPSF